MLMHVLVKTSYAGNIVITLLWAAVLLVTDFSNKLYCVTIDDLVSKETVCCVGGKVKY